MPDNLEDKLVTIKNIVVTVWFLLILITTLLLVSMKGCDLDYWRDRYYQCECRYEPNVPLCKDLMKRSNYGSD